MATVFHHLKRKTYYHRSIVPRRLQPYFKGREQLWRNLKTEDKDEVILKSAQWTARIQQLFLTLRKQGDHMTDEQREVLVSHWLERELDEAEDARTLAGPISDSYREGVWHVFSDPWTTYTQSFGDEQLAEGRQLDLIIKYGIHKRFMMSYPQQHGNGSRHLWNL